MERTRRNPFETVLLTGGTVLVLLSIAGVITTVAIQNTLMNNPSGKLTALRDVAQFAYLLWPPLLTAGLVILAFWVALRALDVNARRRLQSTEAESGTSGVPDEPLDATSAAAETAARSHSDLLDRSVDPKIFMRPND